MTKGRPRDWHPVDFEAAAAAVNQPPAPTRGPPSPVVQIAWTSAAVSAVSRDLYLVDAAHSAADPPSDGEAACHLPSFPLRFAQGSAATGLARRGCRMARGSSRVSTRWPDDARTARILGGYAPLTLTDEVPDTELSPEVEVWGHGPSRTRRVDRSRRTSRAQPAHSRQGTGGSAGRTVRASNAAPFRRSRPSERGTGRPILPR
jgi:hypothetical protein